MYLKKHIVQSMMQFNLQTFWKFEISWFLILAILLCSMDRSWSYLVEGFSPLCACFLDFACYKHNS